MPYIPASQRPPLDSAAEVISKDVTAGEFTYFITRASHRFLGRKFSFYRVALLMGALVCAVLEIYRRVVVPYEEVKRKENGDVY